MHHPEHADLIEFPSRQTLADSPGIPGKEDLTRPHHPQTAPKRHRIERTLA